MTSPHDDEEDTSWHFVKEAEEYLETDRETMKILGKTGDDSAIRTSSTLAQMSIAASLRYFVEEHRYQYKDYSDDVPITLGLIHEALWEINKKLP